VTWSIGDMFVSRIEEGLGLSSVSPDKFLTNFDIDVFRSHADWLVPLHYDPEEDRLVSSIHSWLIRTPRHTILLDTCSGNHKDRPWNERFHQLNTPYLERLRAVGVSPEEVDYVFCTHLHSDHCGWNTRLENGRWVPTFPNAKYLFSRAEKNRWDPAVSADNSRAVLYNDSVLPIIESRQAVLLDDAFEMDRHLLVEPAPGHTVGHMILKAGTGDDRGLFCGDAIHHPIQICEPTWNTRFCEDQEQSARTRRELLEYCVEHRALLFPMHFAPPFVAGVFARGDRLFPAFVPPRK